MLTGIWDKNNELIKTHNISKLAKAANLPETLIEKVAALEPVYQETRYPDVSSEIPADEFDENDAEKFSTFAEEVLEWIEKKIQ